MSQKYNNPPESIIKSRPGFSKVESDIINESEKILSSPEFEKIKIAHKEGKSVTVIIDGRTIQYEPNLPSSGMTMFGEDGFLIGREAFSSKEESAKTVLHELYRLKNSSSSLGVTGELATQETKATFDFANRTIEELIKK